MSIKIKLILILSLVSLVLGVAVWHEMVTVYRVEKKVQLFVPATGYLLGIAEVNTGLARQAKEALDYLVTGDAQDKKEFSQLTRDVERGFELWTTSAERQHALGVAGEIEDAGTGRQIQETYYRWVGHVQGSFDLIDRGQRSLALKQFEQGSWVLLEKQIFSAIDTAMQDGFNEVENAYHELLMAMGGAVFLGSGKTEILTTTHAAIDNVIAGCRVNSTGSRQFSALATYLLTGNIKSLERYEELKIEVRSAIDQWFFAAYEQSVGSDPKLSTSVSDVSKVASSLERLLRLEEAAVRSKQAGGSQQALRMVIDGPMESPLNGHMPLMVFSALESGSQELVQLASRASRQGVVLIGLAFLVVLMLVLHMGQKLLVSLHVLKEGMDAVSRGDLQQQIALGGHDEFAHLASHFNRMSKSLYQSQAEVEQLTSGLEQRVAERTRELAKANQELDAFNSAVSHDLRSPLSLINGYAELLLEGGQPVEAQHESLHAIILAGEKMENIIGTLMDLSRMGTVDLDRRQVNLSALAQDILERYKKRQPQRRVNISLERNLTVEADYDLLLIVLENLLGNAWKYSAKVQPSAIELGADYDEYRRYFYIRDNGAGFDMQQMDRLFRPFQRLHTNAEFAGTGVGLATVQRIIQCHGGEIWAESEVGVGSTFYFTLN